MSAKSESGELGLSMARELTRVATPETEGQWLEASTNKTAPEAARMVNGLERGDTPGTSARPEAEQHRVMLVLSPQAKAMLDAARKRLLEQSGEGFEDDALVMAAMGALLDETAHSGAHERTKDCAPMQVQLFVCEGCGHGEYEGGVVARADEVAAACCDATVVPADGGRAKQTVSPNVRRNVKSKQRGECAVPGCRCRAFMRGRL